MKQNYLISIVGPTGIGKTALGIALARHYKTDIISADSRQFYKEMSIGTAAPTINERQAATHHFIHHKSVVENYSVGDFEKDALRMLNKLYMHHNVVIMVGGSGLYVDAVTKGLDTFPNIDASIRKTLNLAYDTKGLSHLQAQLKTLDPVAFDTIAIDNPHRVIRALEICIGSGRPYSSFLNQPKPKRLFKTITIGLTADRAKIYERINKRVDLMLSQGLLEEARTLKPLQHLNALNTVGYSELFKYFNEEWPLDFAISEIKKNSRRYAKRQLTWFKKNEETIWFDYQTPVENIIDRMAQVLI